MNVFHCCNILGDLVCAISKATTWKKGVTSVGIQTFGLFCTNYCRPKAEEQNDEDYKQMEEGGQQEQDTEKKLEFFFCGLQLVIQVIAIIEAAQQGKTNRVVVEVIKLLCMIFIIYCRSANAAAVFAFVQASFMVPLLMDLMNAGKNEYGLYFMMFIKLVSALVWIQLFFIFKRRQVEASPENTGQEVYPQRQGGG